MEFKKIMTAGFAMFAMLFGSGNIVFPLILGRDLGHLVFFGLAGFVLTAVLVPLIGLLSTMLSDGNYKQFLAPLGTIPAFVVTLLCMMLIGPFAIIPRCVTISHAAVKMHLPSCSLALFSVLSAVIIFLCTVKDSMVVDLLGKYLGPLKLTLLLGIVIKGLFAPAQFVQVGMSKGVAFFDGLLVGYGTCDLLGTIFLSSLILSGLRKSMSEQERSNPRCLLWWGVQAGAIGGILLGIVYAGFCTVAGYYSQMLVGVERSDIFSTLAVLVLGEQGGLLANITLAVACLTTAVALTVVFATYLQKELLHNRISYVTALCITIVVTAGMSNLGFSGIMQCLGPVIEILYPALCMFAVVNIAHKLWGFRYVRLPVVLVLCASLSATFFAVDYGALIQFFLQRIFA